MLPAKSINKMGGIIKPPVLGVDQTILTMIITATNKMSRIATLKEYFVYKADILNDDQI